MTPNVFGATKKVEPIPAELELMVPGAERAIVESVEPLLKKKKNVPGLQRRSRTKTAEVGRTPIKSVDPFARVSGTAPPCEKMLACNC